MLGIIFERTRKRARFPGKHTTARRPRSAVLRMEWLEPRQVLSGPGDVTLRVDVATGDAWLDFHGSQAIGGYEITSASGALNPAGWVPLANSEAGWGVLISTSSDISEGSLSGSFTHDGLQGIGQPFTPGAARDLTFDWLDATGITTYTSSVEYVGAPLAATATALVAAPNPSVAGQAVTLTATVTSAAGTPGGSVAFFDGASSLGTASLNAGGQATLAVSSLAVGTHSLTAVYAGDGTTYDGSTSPAVSQVVQEPSTAATATALVAAPNPSVYGQTVTLTATVTSAGGTPGGSVEFFDGASSLGTATLDGSGNAVLSVSALSAGTHSLTAVYAGEGTFDGSTSAAVAQVVQQAATTTRLGRWRSNAMHGQTIAFIAQVSVVPPGVGPAAGSVNFTVDGTLMATVPLANGVATWQTAALTPGTHTVEAIYLGDANFAGSSDTLVQRVKKAGTHLRLVTSANPSALNQAVTFTATVTARQPGMTGSVTLYRGRGVVGTGTLNAQGKVQFTTTFTTAGKYRITAVYGGDSNFDGSVATVCQQVGATRRGGAPGPRHSRLLDAWNAMWSEWDAARR